LTKTLQLSAAVVVRPPRGCPGSDLPTPPGSACASSGLVERGTNALNSRPQPGALGRACTRVGLLGFGRRRYRRSRDHRTPAPVGTPWSLCPEYATVGFYTQPDGSLLFANEYPGVGCLIARNSGGLLSIYEMRTGAGWVSTIKSSDPQKLDVQWTWPATGAKHQITVQPGKTVIR